MLEMWVVLAISAAFFQALRNAGQKHLSSKVDSTLASGARFIFGFPFAFIGLLLTIFIIGGKLPNSHFWIYGFSCATTQFLGSICVTYLFRRRNFAIGTILLRSEVIFVPMVGFMLLHESVSNSIIIAVIISLLGSLIASLDKLDIAKKGIQIDKTSLLLGCGGGFFFATTMVTIRSATLHGFTDDTPTFLRAITILTFMLFLQSTIIMGWLLITKPRIMNVIRDNLTPCIFSGLTSAAASLCWFFSYTLVPVPQVKIVGQVEFIFTIILTYLYFKEKITFLEWIGAFFIVLATIVTLVF